MVSDEAVAGGRTLRWAGLILLLALAIRFGTVVLSGQYLDHMHHERYEAVRVGIALATSGSFSDPFVTAPTGPTAHVSPGYPILLGTVFRLFGTGTNGEMAKEFLGCLITAVQYALLVLIAPLLGMPVEVGVAAGVLGACLPLDRAIETLGDCEANLIGVLLILLVAGTAKIWREQAFSANRALVQGLMWGIAGLCSAAVLSVEVGLAAGGLVICGGGLRGRLRFVGGMALGTFIALAPWGLRNWIQLGSPVLTRSNLGLELYVSNNDLAASSLLLNMRSMQKLHPTFNADAAAEVRKQGEVAFNHRYLNRAVGWIRMKPARFVELTLARVAAFWFRSYSDSAIRQFLLGLLTLGGFAGLIVLWRNEKSASWALWTVQLVFPLIYYVVQSSPRYRYPINWICILGTVYALSQWLRPNHASQEEKRH